MPCPLGALKYDICSAGPALHAQPAASLTKRNPNRVCPPGTSQTAPTKPRPHPHPLYLLQSGGFRSLCDKMKESTLADCDKVPSVSLAPEIIRSPPPPPVFSDIENTDNPFGRRLLAAPPPPSPRAGPRSAAPASAPANAPAPTPAPAPAPSPALSPPARSPCPADSKWYLYLDTTNPPSADSAALSLKGTVDDGDLLAALKRTGGLRVAEMRQSRRVVAAGL